MSLESIIRKGTCIDKSPLLVLLHGYGSNKEDLFSFNQHLPKEYTVVSYQGPIHLPWGGYAWFDINSSDNFKKWENVEQAKNSMASIISSINHDVKSLNLDAKDITLIGFSQGAVLSWALGFNHPEKFRRIIGLSGYISENITPMQVPPILCYASHGKQDFTLPIELARNSIESLSEKYHNITYYEFNDGHHLSEESLNSFLTWLEKTKL